MNRARKTGILGGTFDPVHLGHLRAAEEAAEALGLDELVFIPSATPPHRPNAPRASAEDRLEMARLAVAGRPGFSVSGLEVARGGASYSVETLAALEQERPGEERWFLVGTDAFLDIHAWRDWARLFSLAHFAVMTRPGPDPELAGLGAVERYMKDRLAKAKIFVPAKDEGWTHVETGRRLVFTPIRSLDISATLVRSLLAENRSVRYLVPDAVLDYIEHRKLYGKSPGSRERQKGIHPD
ncbi:MAG: nicotinate-nucleotide adenylyltransferase [Proteobacteria bacterium]|nr:nicotinate-nucleotide adenylyltransferase [Pseudomonadota bacterium]